MKPIRELNPKAMRPSLPTSNTLWHLRTKRMAIMAVIILIVSILSVIKLALTSY